MNRNRFLIVEDSADDFEATKRAFARANLHNPIQRAETAEEALAYLRSPNEPKPGLILLDLNLPGLDGRKTLDIIKQTEALRRIPVVVLTTSDDERDIEVLLRGRRQHFHPEACRLRPSHHRDRQAQGILVRDRDPSEGASQ